MLQLKNTLSKDEINQLPVTQFPGAIHVIRTEEAAVKAVDYLRTQPILGIDTETRPSFHAGQRHRVALLQVASEEAGFLFRLNVMGLPACVADLLMNDTLKVGLSLKDDFGQLRQLDDRLHITQGQWIDLQQYAPRFGIHEMGLQKIYALLFGEKISKRQQLSDWEADTLTEAQQQYAVIDAWACVRIYKCLSLYHPDNYTITLYQK